MIIAYVNLAWQSIAKRISWSTLTLTLGGALSASCITTVKKGQLDSPKPWLCRHHRILDVYKQRDIRGNTSRRAATNRHMAALRRNTSHPVGGDDFTRGRRCSDKKRSWVLKFNKGKIDEAGGLKKLPWNYILTGMATRRYICLE